MGSKKGRLRAAAERIRRGMKELAEHKYTTIAGVLAFFLVLSVAPLLFLVTLLFGGQAIPEETLSSLGLFGWAEDLVVFLNANASATAGVSVLFLATTLWSASNFFFHLRRSGEILYDCRRVKTGWKVRLSAIGLTLCVLFLLAGAGGILVTLTVLFRGFPRPISRGVLFSALFVLGFFTAWLLNTYVCPYKCRPAETLFGSLLTAGLWLAASAAFALYAEFSGAEKLYGALALAVVFLFWLYWMMVCFTVGAVFNRVRMRGGRHEHKKL